MNYIHVLERDFLCDPPRGSLLTSARSWSGRSKNGRIFWCRSDVAYASFFTLTARKREDVEERWLDYQERSPRSSYDVSIVPLRYPVGILRDHLNPFKPWAEPRVMLFEIFSPMHGRITSCSDTRCLLSKTPFSLMMGLALFPMHRYRVGDSSYFSF